MSDWIAWEPCPNCRARAAVGLVDRLVTEFDCSRGCTLTPAQEEELRTRGQASVRLTA